MNNLWTTPIEDITFADVVDFCSRQEHESLRLDYKAGYSAKDPGKQVAKLVSAFANTHGGMAIFGVQEHPPKSRLPEANPIGTALGANPRDSAIQACAARLFPPFTPEVSEYLPNPDKPEAGFLVLRVHPGPEPPYSVDDRRGIYVRVEDKSEPVRASVAEIEYMFERKRSRVSRQTERAEMGAQRLLRAMCVVPSTYDPRDELQGYLRVAIGPTIAETPLMEVAELLKSAPPAGYGGRPTPVIDGAYQTSANGDGGWLKDIYGNIILAQDGFRGLIDMVAPPSFPLLEDDWLTSRLQGGKLPQISIVKILRPVFFAVEASRIWCMKEGYYGLLTVSVAVRGILHAALRAGLSIVAANRTDESIQFSFDFASTDFGEAGLYVLDRCTRQLLLAWGHRGEIEHDAILDHAEIEINGSVPCEEHRDTPRPKRWAGCFKCRREAAAN